MNRLKQNIYLRAKFLKLRARNFFLLSDGDSLKLATLRREVLQSSLGKKSKEKFVKKVDKEIKKHIAFVKKVDEAKEHKSDY